MSLMKWWNGWIVECSHIYLHTLLTAVRYIYVHCWMQSYIFTYIAECSHIYLHTWLNATYRAPSELTNMKALLTTMPVWTICSQFCEYTPYLGLKCTLFFCKVYLQWCQLVKRVLLTLVTLGKWLPEQWYLDNGRHKVIFTQTKWRVSTWRWLVQLVGFYLACRRKSR